MSFNLNLNLLFFFFIFFLIKNKNNKTIKSANPCTPCQPSANPDKEMEAAAKAAPPTHGLRPPNPILRSLNKDEHRRPILVLMFSSFRVEKNFFERVKFENRLGGPPPPRSPTSPMLGGSQIGDLVTPAHLLYTEEGGKRPSSAQMHHLNDSDLTNGIATSSRRGFAPDICYFFRKK